MLSSSCLYFLWAVLSGSVVDVPSAAAPCHKVMGNSVLEQFLAGSQAVCGESRYWRSCFTRWAGRTFGAFLHPALATPVTMCQEFRSVPFTLLCPCTTTALNVRMHSEYFDLRGNIVGQEAATGEGHQIVCPATERSIDHFETDAATKICWADHLACKPSTVRHLLSVAAVGAAGKRLQPHSTTIGAFRSRDGQSVVRNVAISEG